MEKLKEWEPGYKVVRKVGSLDPAFVSCNSPKELEYHPGESTVPEKGDGPLAIFGEDAAAKNFIDETVPGPYVIMEAAFVATRLGEFTQEPYTLWSLIPDPFKPWEMGRYSLPPGTILASEVYLFPNGASNENSI